MKDFSTTYDYIESFRLINFQSWDQSAPEIKLYTDIINAIRGRSEIGKSVILKVLYEFYFPGKYGIEDILRDFSNAGALYFKLQSKTEIAMIMGRKFRQFMIKRPNEDAVALSQLEVPEEVTKLLGLLVDKENEIILNVISDETPSLFIKTPPKLAGALLKSITEPEEIKQFQNNCQQKLLDLAGARDTFKYHARLTYNQYETIEFVDAEALYDKSILCSRLASRVHILNKIYNTLVDIGNSINALPSKDWSKVDACGKIVKLYESLEKSCNSLQVIQNNTYKDYSSVEQYVLVSDKLRLVVPNLKGIRDNLQKDIKVPKDLNDSIPDLINATERLQRAGSILRNIKESVLHLERIDYSLKQTVKSIENLETQLGVCPTCGRIFNDKSNIDARAT